MRPPPGADMHADGYTDVTCIDFAESVITDLQTEHKGKEETGLRFEQVRAPAAPVLRPNPT
jgi:hypothetical protein